MLLPRFFSTVRLSCRESQKESRLYARVCMRTKGASLGPSLRRATRHPSRHHETVTMDPSRSPERSSGGRVRKTSLGHGSLHGEKGSSYGMRGTLARSNAGASSGLESRTAGYAAQTTGMTSGGSRRMNNFLGGDDRMIFDIGSRVTRAGHSGEARPRSMVWSLRQSSPADQYVDLSCQGMLYTLDVARRYDETERRIAEYKLKSRLKVLLRALFHDVISQDPKGRRVILIENAFMPTIVKDFMRDILFGNLQVASVSFAPSHLMSAVAIGRLYTLVLDLGYEQATLVPIYLWRPMTPRYLFTSPRSARRLSQRLKALLIHYGTYVAPGAPSVSGNTFAAMRDSNLTATSRKGKIPTDLLDDDVLDEVKAKALFVGPPLDVQRDSLPAIRHPSEWEKLQPFTEINEEEDEAWMKELRARYEKSSSVKDIVITVPPLPFPSIIPASQPATLGTSPTPARQGRGVIIVPGWVRERATEVLFEQGDDDEPSLTEMVLNALHRLPIDLRQAMAQNIYLVGGTAMLPGLAHRLRLELVRTLSQASAHATPGDSTLTALTQPTVGFHKGRRILPEHPLDRERTSKMSATTASSEQTDASFVSAQPDVGDETFMTTNEAGLGTNVLPKKASTSLNDKAYTKYTPLAPLIEHVAVINDHAPRLNVDGKPVTGAAPSFPVNLSAWIGASLIGSLHVDSLNQMLREEWEEAQERARREAESKREHGDRPSLGLGRGSFLGTVGGLDLGTYGPLSASARNRFAGGANPRSPTSNPRSPPLT